MSLIYEPAEDSYLILKVIKKELTKSKIKNLRILEVGSGGGFILEGLIKLNIPKKNIQACDINEEAVKKCKTLGFNCSNSDLFSNIKDSFDLIIFNPPYLPENKLEDKESQLATTGGRYGSEIINKFLVQAKNYLNKNGKILLLTSSLTKNIDWKSYKKKCVAKKKLFFEELFVWKLRVIKKIYVR